MSDYGVITLATKHDYVKAVGMLLSIKQSTPDVLVTLVSSPEIGDAVGHYFDSFVPENKELKGFEHKLHLDSYSPYEKTFFFDADILVFGNLDDVQAQWAGRPYIANGRYLNSGLSSFGLDRQYVMSKLNKDKLVNIGGAGHAYFERPACEALFELARKIGSNYEDYANKCRFADEDVVAIAMTILDLPPAELENFVARVFHARKGTMAMDVSRSECSFISAKNGALVQPFLVHFATREGGLLYYRNLRKLFNRHGIDLHKELAVTFINDFRTLLNWRSKSMLKKILKS
ncbi:hypothetical protein [Methylophaga sp. OBS4]|uniref:hypothetical protein n=1 Tax=Methylophaga sp. OBS4 TaxID=2991935 RepID=UPI002257E2D6|nr:hypothetical protein [Methylophaga sp. OBS4]MCX4188429.1 hypothetical protein [Methylophaga sp. OBS4]